MLIKRADDQSDALYALERRAAGTGADARHAADELRIRKAGLKGEAESAYLIDFEFAKSPNWAVLHDLRLEHGGRVAQIDHLLINRWMDMYVLETKHFHAGLKITEDGEFLRWNAYRKTYEGMASPLEQNDRHIAVLRDVVSAIALPQRLGLRIPPSFFSLVLVAPAARIDRPRRFDASRVIKADQLKKRIWKDIDGENGLVALFKAAKIVAPETVEFVARQLAARHAPLAARQTPPPAVVPVSPAPPARPPAPGAVRKPRIEPTLAAATPALPVCGEGPACKRCGHRLGAILYGRYGYYFKCASCAANTAVRFTCQPGHQPRLRKDGPAFYRECAACGTSVLFHRNAAGAGHDA